MRYFTIVTMTLALAAVPAALLAQGRMGGREGMEGGFRQPAEIKPPKLPGPELEGPPVADTLRAALHLTDDQAAQYSAARDSFMLATKPTRDSAFAEQDKMYAKLDAGDRVAAEFYAERLMKLDKTLDEAQKKFEDRLSRIFKGDQMRTYREWRERQDQWAQDKADEEAIRWRVRQFATGLPVVEPHVAVDVPGVARGAGSAAIRVGQTVYVSSQVAVDANGAIVGEGDLAAQARQAFANLTATLQAAHSKPHDVVRLRLYVVGYQPAQLDTIRAAGADYFPDKNPPAVTVLGVQSLSQPGLLIAVEATAVDAPETVMPERRR